MASKRKVSQPVTPVEAVDRDDGCGGRHGLLWGEALKRRVRESSGPPSAMRTDAAFDALGEAAKSSLELRELRKYSVTGARATPSLTRSSQAAQRHAQACFPWSPTSISSQVKGSVAAGATRDPAPNVVRRGGSCPQIDTNQYPTAIRPDRGRCAAVAAVRVRSQEILDRLCSGDA